MDEIVRPGTAADAEAACRLFQAHLNWINVWFEPDEVFQRRTSVEQVHSMFREYPSAIAESHGAVVGFAVSCIREPNVLELFNLYVDDPYRKRGVGTRLITSVEHQAAEMGMHSIVATVSTNYFPGKALPEGLYHRLGFEVHDLAAGTQLYIKRMFEPEQKKRFRFKLSTSGEFIADEEPTEIQAPRL
jgi:GNAT superfamily N-acetyltransferase